ncbi:protein NO VEIN domain-containing protein [Kocuria sp. KH4]
MPVVLTTAEGREQAGYTYDDHTGASYEYPSGKYENYIFEGEPFIYHKPGVGYVGTGVIGRISPSASAGRLVCQVLDYRPFSVPVSIKRQDGSYFEADRRFWKTGNVYWAQGVRPLGPDQFLEIVGAPPVVTNAIPPSLGAYANPETAMAVDKYAMSAALEWCRAEWPNAPVLRMSHNNPGYDIRVGGVDSVLCYVEVKGTQSREPQFWLSEGERVFSETHADGYRLVVVTGISIERQSHVNILVHRGALSTKGVDLQPAQWRGRLVESDNAIKIA